MWWIILIIIVVVMFLLKFFNDSHRVNQSKHQIIRSNNNMELSNIRLSNQQKKLFEKIESSSEHMFITGKAGTGKSVLLQYLKQHTNKNMVVLAPTGVAALNVSGQTIHSFFRIPPSFVRNENLKLSYKTSLLLRNLDCIVIDEISMVRADLMDAIDYLLRKARSENTQFGGVQMIMFGDLYQLPPVVSDPELHKYFEHNHGGYYFFNAHAWKNDPMNIYELTENFRQKDETFRLILNSIRTGSIDDKALSHLNRRVSVIIPKEGVITLAPTNGLVSEINHQKLLELQGKTLEYRATITGDLEQSSFPTDEILKLKKGAQVMFLRNDKQKRWVNGTIGYIESLGADIIKVNIDGIVFPVQKETWNKIRYQYNQAERTVEEETVSSFTQFPLRLAWAITIHKSQGQTYKSVLVDMQGGAFAHGQTYVALSRCKSLTVSKSPTLHIYQN